MQKVVGSSPISRFGKPRKSQGFLLDEASATTRRWSPTVPRSVISADAARIASVMRDRTFDLLRSRQMGSGSRGRRRRAVAGSRPPCEPPSHPAARINGARPLRRGSRAMRCGWRDSNPHGLPHRLLRPARLPIPPQPRTAVDCRAADLESTRLGALAKLDKAPVSKTGDSRFESWVPR